MATSPTIGAIAKALAGAQKEMLGALKESFHPHLKVKYANMESVVAAIKGPLAKHSIAYTQLTQDAEKGVGVETILMHESGEWISSTLVLPVAKTDPQAYGSALTYARRYALMAIVGMAAEDDDGQRADMAGDGSSQAPAAAAGVEMPKSKSADAIPAQERSSTPAEGGLTADMQKVVSAQLKASGKAEADLLAHFRVGSIAAIPSGSINEALTWLKG